MKQQIHSTNSKHTKASVYCRIANEIHIPTDQYDLALECLQTALNLVSRSNSVDSLDEAFLNLDDEEDDPNQVSDTTLNTATRNREIIKLQLYQTKADVLFRLGRIEQAWDEYEKAYQYAMTTMSYPPNPAEVAKMLYKLGRICIKLRRIPTAIQYFEQELEVTQRTLGTSRHFSVSRIYHELATVHDRYQNDHRRALQCLQDAYEIENQLYTQCQHEIDECRQCSAIRYCPRHQQYFKDCIHQLHETKNSQGRIHYKLGNFEKALEASLQHTNALGGGSAVATAAGGDGADADVDNQ
uniref:Anaphase-promoting complex subunit 5 domain-containing protein n=1 Tax=Craspedostauros australis TaxID=1486917 RepID=A0A7R9WR25_9STRA